MQKVNIFWRTWHKTKAYSGLKKDLMSEVRRRGGVRHKIVKSMKFLNRTS